MDTISDLTTGGRPIATCPQSPNTIPVAYRPPFALGATPYRDARPHGETVLDIVRTVPDLPRGFLSRGVVCINGEPVPRALWSYTRPKPNSENLPIAVTLHYPLSGGGGGGGGKQIAALVAAIALVAVATIIAGPLGTAAVGSLLGLTGVAATIAATAIAGAVSVAGALAISALTAPPTTDVPALSQDTNADNREAAGAQGNVISPGGSIPRVLGTRKVYPPFICEPLVELVDEDEFVEAVVALNGPHLLEDIRIDGVPIVDAEDVEYETREGFSTDTPVSITRHGRTITPQLTLSQFKLTADNGDLLDSDDPENDLPIWHGIVSRDSPDEIWIHLLLPGGLSTDASTRTVVPFRIRIRQKGTVNWFNFPEIHYSNNSVKQQRLAILLKWETAPAISGVEQFNGFIYANRAPNPQTIAPATPAEREWTADGYFDDGAGNNFLFIGQEATTRLRNLNLYQNRAEFYLDEGTFPKDIYEIEIKRGLAFVYANFNKATYAYSGSVKDFFWYNDTGNPQPAQDQSNVSDRIILTRVASVWNESPTNITSQYFAFIAILARNRSIQRISVRASGYVDINGWMTSSNPAVHYIDVLAGSLNLDPLPGELIDIDGLTEWAALCETNEWTCDAIIDDMRTQDVLTLLASCAYAKPYQSDQYGVTMDNDKSAESPVQVFSRINASNIKFERAFIRVPEAFIVSYRDETTDDDRAQTIVYPTDTSAATTGLFESVAYDGLIDEAKVQARAQFDLDQATQRATFYSLDTDIEAIVCRRGSLVALQHDVLTSRAGDGHIYSYATTGSPATITGITLDAEIDIISGDTGVAIRHTDGTITTHTLSNATGSTKVLTFSTPFADDNTITGYNNTSHEYGCLVVAGELGTEYKRMLVAQITATKDLKASIVLVDEAPDLVRYAP